KEAKAATVLVLAKTGSKYEEREISGISHFLEHMLFKGTEKRKEPKDVAEVLDKVGGEYNAFTGEEYTGYYAKVDEAHFDVALDWVSDIFLNSKIPSKEIEKERGVIIEEINMYDDNPMMYIDELWKTVLYGDQPAGWDTAGTKETVSKISRNQILKYIYSQYVADNVIICIAGKVNEKMVIEKIKKYFSRIKTGKAKDKPKVIENQTEPQVKVSFKKMSQGNLALGVRGVNTFSPDKYVFDVMAVILGGMMSSRMFIEIREKMGAAYYVRTYNSSDTDTGSLVTFAGVDNNKINKVIETILKEYRKLCKVKVSDGELKKAKDYIKGKMVLGLESSDAQASFYGSQELLKNEILTIEEIFKRVDKVKSSDIMRVAKDIFKNEKLNLAVIGPFEDDKQFKEILKFK
ncbi:MAG: pitrilysin family protein, partial [Minisyncoccales bacterium]